ncbi:hypothetical protein WJX73_010025 [Symbiochloris irregularis]|uniref:THUMP domain-containing protein n=1 Tax=Symbiochloris irregularis TaxID=706552 RepID=A0AAW1Q0R0_9CHLO
MKRKLEQEAERAMRRRAPGREVEGSSAAPLARFGYNALLQKDLHLQTGYLVTCAFRREKSATAEAALLVEKAVSALDASTQAPADSSFSRLHLPAISVAHPHADSRQPDTEKQAEKGAVRSCEPAAETGACKADKPVQSSLSFVKDSWAGTGHNDRFCERIMPVQRICTVSLTDLREAAKALSAAWPPVQDLAPIGDDTLTFAVAYRSRGTLQTGRTSDSTAPDRSSIVSSLAEGCVEGFKSSLISRSVKVDLSSPQVVLLAETVPLSGRVLCGLCLMNIDYMTTKSKLALKPLQLRTNNK